MTFDEYTKQANSTAIYKDKLIYPLFGLGGEVGEVYEKVKKSLRDKGSIKELDKEGILCELGDILWYVNAIANDLGYSLKEVANINLKKLFSRKERGMIKGSGDNR